MCDQDQLARWAKQTLSRRTFGAGTLAGAAVACSPMESTAALSDDDVTMRTITFPTDAGTLDGEFYTKGSEPKPGVIFWPDIAGIRPAKREMAKRLAAAGYSVLLANPYYRDVAGQQFEDFASFAGSGGFQSVRPWREKFTAETISADNSDAADWLLTQPEVDPERGIGVQGYCMTGSFAVLGPWSEEVIRAGASFHGGGLVREGENSPHRVLVSGEHYLIAISQDDDAGQPDAKTTLREAATQSKANAEIEVYPADHGFCVLDSPSYDEAQAERAWTRLLALYEEAL